MQAAIPFHSYSSKLALYRLIDTQQILREKRDCKKSNENLLWDNFGTNYCQIPKADGLTTETSKENQHFDRAGSLAPKIFTWLTMHREKSTYLAIEHKLQKIPAQCAHCRLHSVQECLSQKMHITRTPHLDCIQLWHLKASSVCKLWFWFAWDF